MTSHFRCKGDSDPVDVVEIGRKLHKRGTVVVVKVLGTLAMIDEGDLPFMTNFRILFNFKGHLF